MSPSPRSHRNAIADILANDRPVNWIFTGDSITHGAFHSLGHRDYPEHFSERLRWEMQRLYHVVVTTGISGWTINDLSEHFEWAVLKRDPDVVSINLGINDCAKGPGNLETFIALYRSVLDRILAETNAAVILHTPNAIDAGPQWNRESLLQYVEAIRMIAAEHNVVLVDHAKVWEEARGNASLAYWLSDALHPNEYGHRVMAHTLFQELGIFDSQSAVCRLMIP